MSALPPPTAEKPCRDCAPARGGYGAPAEHPIPEPWIPAHALPGSWAAAGDEPRLFVCGRCHAVHMVVYEPREVLTRFDRLPSGEPAWLIADGAREALLDALATEDPLCPATEDLVANALDTMRRRDATVRQAVADGILRRLAGPRARGARAQALLRVLRADAPFELLSVEPLLQPDLVADPSWLALLSRLPRPGRVADGEWTRLRAACDPERLTSAALDRMEAALSGGDGADWRSFGDDVQLVASLVVDAPTPLSVSYGERLAALARRLADRPTEEDLPGFRSFPAKAGACSRWLSILAGHCRASRPC